MKICHITTYWPTWNCGHPHDPENRVRGMRAHWLYRPFVMTRLVRATVANPCESDT